jgi:hypothetical protein
MYFENRPVAPVIEKTVYESEGHYGGNNSRDTRGKATAGLTLGIIGTVLGAAALWGRNGGGIGNILGGGGGGTSNGTPTNININGGDTSYSGGGYGHTAPTAFEAYEKGCAEALALTSAIYQQRINGMAEAAATRNVDVNEKFQLWKSQIDADFGLYVNNRDNIDKVNNRINDELFSLYKYTRDKDDETRKELCDLKALVAVAAAVRPYQDKLLMCEIEKNYTAGINYVDRRMCKTLQGVVTLPTSPTVTGITSYCCCSNQTPAAGG